MVAVSPFVMALAAGLNSVTRARTRRNLFSTMIAAKHERFAKLTPEQVLKPYMRTDNRARIALGFHAE